MAKQTINLGTGPDSYTGDTLRVAFDKVNDNFDELYAGEIQGNIYGNVITANTFVTNANAILGNLRVLNDATIVGDVYARQYYFANSNITLSNIDAQVTYSIENYSGNIGSNIFIANTIRTSDSGVSIFLETENDELTFSTQVSGNIATLSNAGHLTLENGLTTNEINGNISGNSLSGQLIASVESLSGDGNTTLIINPNVMVSAITTSANGDSAILANATTVGTIKIIVLETDGGGNLTVTPSSLINGSSIIFSGAGDTVSLMWLSSGWVVTAYWN